MTYAEVKTQLGAEDREVGERLLEARQPPPQVLARLLGERGMSEPAACHYLKRLLRSAISLLRQ